MFQSYYEIQMMLNYRRMERETFMAERRLVRAARKNRGQSAAAAALAGFSKAIEKASAELENRLAPAPQRDSCMDCEEPLAS